MNNINYLHHIGFALFAIKLGSHIYDNRYNEATILKKLADISISLTPFCLNLG